MEAGVAMLLCLAGGGAGAHPLLQVTQLLASQCGPLVGRGVHVLVHGHGHGERVLAHLHSQHVHVPVAVNSVTSDGHVTVHVTSDLEATVGLLRDLRRRLPSLASQRLLLLGVEGASRGNVTHALQALWASGFTNVVTLVAFARRVTSHVTVVTSWGGGGGRRRQTVTSLDVRPGRGRKGCVFFDEDAAATDRDVLVSTFVTEPYVMRGFSSGSDVTCRSGLEVQLLHVVCEALRWRLTYREPPRDAAATAWAGVLHDVSGAASDVAMAGLYLTADRARSLAFTLPYYGDGAAWVVARAGPVPALASLAGTFPPLTWTLIATVYVIVTAALHRLGHVTVSTCALDTWSAQLGNAVYYVELRKRRTWRLRAFVAMFVTYGIMVNTAFKSTLISVLVNPRDLPQVSSVGGIARAAMTVGITNFTKASRAATVDHVPDADALRQLLRQPADESSLQSRLARAAAGVPAFATVAPRFYVQYTSVQHFSDAEGRALLYPFNDDMDTYLYVMYVAKGSPLLHAVDRVISHVMEAGLTLQWKKWLMFSLQLEAASNRSASTASGVRVLSLTHLQSAFTLLALGLPLAVATFLAELAWRARARARTPTPPTPPPGQSP